MQRNWGRELLDLLARSVPVLLVCFSQICVFHEWGALAGYVLLPVLYALGVGLIWFLGTKFWDGDCDGMIALSAFSALYAYLFSLPVLFRVVPVTTPVVILGAVIAVPVLAGIVFGSAAKVGMQLAHCCQNNPFPGSGPSGPLSMTV